MSAWLFYCIIISCAMQTGFVLFAVPGGMLHSFKHIYTHISHFKLSVSRFRAMLI